MAMETLNRVAAVMEEFGWSDGGRSGSAKWSMNGQKVAEHGDATWIADMQLACETVQAQDAMAELNRRLNAA